MSALWKFDQVNLKSKETEFSGEQSEANFPPVLDATCGSKMMWFDEKDERALFFDRRCETHTFESCAGYPSGGSVVVAPNIRGAELGNNILDSPNGEWIVWVRKMKRINPFAFYQFGQAIQPLLALPVGGIIKDWSAVILTGASWIETTCNSPLLPLRVCQNAGNNAVAWLRQLASKPPDSAILSTDATMVIGALLDFQAVLREELNVSDTYIVAQKAHYSTTTLIEFGELMFPEEIRKELPAEAIYDIQQGARCFAFELPTAAGFHFLRTVEAVIHKFYDVLSGNASRPKRGAMGIYIDELIKLNANQELVATLKQIKDLHRNPVVHPEETLDMIEAQMLMGIMQSAIFAMIQIVKEKQVTASSVVTDIP